MSEADGIFYVNAIIFLLLVLAGLYFAKPKSTS